MKPEKKLRHTSCAMSFGNRAKPSRSYRPLVGILLLHLLVAFLQAQTVSTGGNLKYRFQYARYPEDSLYYPLTGNASTDHALTFRFDLGANHGHWDAEIDYQFMVLDGDFVEILRVLPNEVYHPGQLPSDRYRLFDLTYVFTDEGDQAILNRLDRFSVGYTVDDGVVRFGRQAITWGNGMIFTPMDFFNPFDPTAIDKEYKTGDDMLYGQIVQDNGNDLQAVWVIRRDASGDVTSEVDSIALKYHAFISDLELDFLFSQHYEATIIGVGGIYSLGDGVLRGDLTLTQTETETVFSGVASYAYSWTWWEKNISGLAEVFYNGFGQPNGDYRPESLARNEDLLVRIGRGELFTLGRSYLAISAIIEMTPLWLLTPNAFINFSDGSALVQIVSQHDIAQDWQLLAAFNLPIGASGTEYGGIPALPDVESEPVYLSNDWGLTVQLAWYF